MQCPVLEEDSKTVYLVLGDLAYKWMRTLDNSMNGRLTMDTLRAHFEGNHVLAVKEVEANDILENKRYATQLKKDYTVLSHNRLAIGEQTMVE